MAKDKLDQRQRDFCVHYVQHGKKKQAAIDAGYAERSAHVTASRLLKLAKVQDEIKRLHTAKHMGPEEVMAGLAEIARLDMEDFISPLKNGGARLNLPKAKRANKLSFIREITTKESQKISEGDVVSEVVETKVKLYDRQRALETIAKHHGLLKDAEININITLHLDLITRTWQALEKAGADPEQVFNELIDAANTRTATRIDSA